MMKTEKYWKQATNGSDYADEKPAFLYSLF